MPNFRRQRIAGRIVRAVTAMFIIVINLLIVWRVFFSTKLPDNIGVLTQNDALSRAYAEHGDDLQLLWQDQATVTRAEKNYGYFSIPEFVFIPEAKQVQVVFRYNNGTIKSLAADYGLEELPARDSMLYDVTLVRTTDLTPDNKEDNSDPATLQSERFFAASEPILETTSLYVFCRYTFEGVSVEDMTAGVFIDIYYKEDIDYEKDAYGTLCIYSPEDEWMTRDLTREDKNSLKQ